MGMLRRIDNRKRESLIDGKVRGVTGARKGDRA